MNEPRANDPGCSAATEEEVQEVPVLLSRCHLHDLETAACRRGLTTAELLRCLITKFLELEKGQC